MEWKEVRLGDVCSIQRGASPRPIQKFISKEGMPWVKIADATGISSRYISSTSEYIIKEGVSKSRIVHPGDLIVSNSATPGLPKFMAIEACVHDGWLIIRDLDGIDKVFLYYVFINIRRRLSNQANGSVFMNLKTDIVKDFVIKLPTLEDQLRIASILSALDRKIELNNKINADLEEMAQAIFKNWFVDFEPFKDGKFVDSELGMIPEGWRVGTLEDLITIKYGKDHKKLEDGTFPVYGSGGLMRFVNSWLYNGESVLIPRKGTLDNIMYVCEKFWTVDTMFFSIPKMDYVMKYVYNYIKRFDFSKMNEGTSVPSNTAARLNKMQILIPTHEVLEMYDETLCPIYNKRKMNDKESRTLSLLRDTLLPRLMSGELEIPE
ncbi:restriction endonuclease subunit S [Segatella sp.]